MILGEEEPRSSSQILEKATKFGVLGLEDDMVHVEMINIVESRDKQTKS